MRLAPLTAAKAADILVKTGSGVFTREVAERVVREIANTDRVPGPAGHLSLEHMSVDPSALQLVARTLYLRARHEGHTVTVASFGVASIMADFVSTSLTDQPRAVKKWIRNRLVTPSGYRTVVDWESAVHELGSDAALRTLQDRRLLTVSQREGRRHVELSHDLIAAAIVRA